MLQLKKRLLQLCLGFMGGLMLLCVRLRLIKSQQQIRPQKLIECAKIAFTKLEVLIFGPIWFNVVAVRKFQH